MEEIIPFHKVIGLQLIEMDSGTAKILVPYKPILVGDPRTNHIHGGVISTAMDAAGGAAGMTTLNSSKDQISTIDIRIDYLYPGKPEDILVEGSIVKDGSSVIFTQMTAYHPSNKELIAEGRAIYRVKRI
ncbi:hotdog fold thioesterase [Fulvivirgaceae bacterium BMA10]|uniref:Hotdog fold thioesterase n=1 Tax=Splendidivirga corallicola TaxID=3051826 RepID=A0ABT8KW03_9BACT|nr:hotdog fold thioesterase [Fulvivirgaceae bacterium BMA10]